MKKILIVLLIVLTACSLLLLKEDKPDIVSILKTDPDAKEFIAEHENYEMTSKVLTAEDIEEGKSGQDFKEVYQDLESEDGRYLKADLVDGSKGIIAVLDLKAKKVLKVFGLIKLGTGI
ncbi:hypothetical protein KKG36_03195 [Patescibacteria group bacterium]|nr:hypothetical protein [Patescibacteria group bacterium]